MKPLQSGNRKQRLCVARATGAEGALSLQEELVAAIHGAFEVAVEIVVQEVSKLVGQATGDLYEEMRRENESLKQRLQRAEATLGCASLEDRGGGGGSPPPAAGPPSRPNRRHKGTSPKDGILHGCAGVRGQGCADQRPDAPHRNASTGEEQSADQDEDGDVVKSEYASDAASEAEKNNGYAVSFDTLTKEVSEMSCEAQGSDAPPLSSRDEFSLQQASVKQERPEEQGDGEGDSACCLDSIKVENFSLECISEVQSKMLEEWRPEVLDTQSQDSITPLSCSALAQALPSNLSSSLPPPTDLPSLPSELQPAEAAPTPEAPPQAYGVHVRSGRGLGTHTLYACRSCGQTFHLPSLLRRHHGHCQHRPQQWSQQQLPSRDKRTRLQLYPPGCSPFRCTECNREFNRMENLKTHLRIHTGERPYTCSVCSKCFRHSGALTRHFRIHTGEKPYICGQCGKSFRNCGGLKFHQRSHSKQP